MQTSFATPAVYAELQSIADGVKAKRAAEQARAAAHYVPMAAEAVADRVTRLQLALADARSGFDPAYDRCDDYTEWCRQAAKAANIAHCTRELERLGVVA